MVEGNFKFGIGKVENVHDLGGSAFGIQVLGLVGGSRV